MYTLNGCKLLGKFIISKLFDIFILFPLFLEEIGEYLIMNVSNHSGHDCINPQIEYILLGVPEEVASLLVDHEDIPQLALAEANHHKACF